MNYNDFKEYALRATRDMVLIGMGIYSTLGLFHGYEGKGPQIVRGKIQQEAPAKPSQSLEAKTNHSFKGKKNFNHLIPKQLADGSYTYDKVTVNDRVFKYKETTPLDINHDGKPDVNVKIYENKDYQRITEVEFKGKPFAYGISLAPAFPEDGNFNFLIIDGNLDGSFKERRAMKDKIPKKYLDDILAKN